MRAATLLALAVEAGSVGLASGKPAAPPVSIGGTLQGVTAVLPDPKHPGKPLWKLLARSVDAGPTGLSGYAVVLHDVAATLYQNGIPEAYMTAPRAVGDQSTRTITATGGVFIKSLTDRGPSGRSTLRADRVQWQADKNQVLATGHVAYKNGKNGLILRGPAFQADTALRTLHSVGAGRIILPRGLR